MTRTKKIAAGLIVGGIGLMTLSSLSNEAQSGTLIASWYGEELRGQKTASGEPFNPDGYTAASKTLPLGTRLRVSNEGKSVDVRINDRGPYVAGRDLDLSKAAAEKIGVEGAEEVNAEQTSSAPVEELPKTSGFDEVN